MGLIAWGLFISLVGFVFFKFGRKTSKPLAMIIGILLTVYPYFVWSTGWSIGIGIAICISYPILKKFI